MALKRRVPTNMDQLLKDGRKKFVRYEEGAAIYSLGINTFKALAKDAGALYHVKKIALCNTEIIDEYLENFRDEF